MVRVPAVSSYSASRAALPAEPGERARGKDVTRHSFWPIIARAPPDRTAEALAVEVSERDSPEALALAHLDAAPADEAREVGADPERSTWRRSW